MLIKKCIEALLFFLAGCLIRISFSGQLNYIENILIFICAIIIIIYITIENIENQIKK